jgi:hypothetical protein
MRLEGYDDDLLDEEEVIDEFLGENPRARDLRLMRQALEHRLSMFQRDQERSKEERERAMMLGKIAELHKQIAAIRQEEEITTFVEGSVRITLRNTPLHELDY